MRICLFNIYMINLLLCMKWFNSWVVGRIYVIEKDLDNWLVEQIKRDKE